MYIPPHVRAAHVHLIGRTGTGKSSVIERMVLDDIETGHGFAVLDPHGRLVDRLVRLIPQRHAGRVIYADPGDPDHVLSWNPLALSTTAPSDGASSFARHDEGRVADDIVAAFKSFSTGWGDRLEHLFRHAIIAVMHLPNRWRSS